MTATRTDTNVTANISVTASFAVTTIPTLTSVHIVSNNASTSRAKIGDIITLTFTSSTSISTPTVTIAGASASVTGGPTSWSATHTMLTGDTEGIVPFTIDFADLSSNAGIQVTATTDASSVTFDKTSPTVTEVTPVSTPTSNPTPSYTFNSTEAGSITYGGDCSSVTTSATSGNNTITFNTLADGAHSNCTITITDATGNLSTALSITTFTVSTIPPATKFIIINPTDNIVGNNVTVTVQAQDASNNIATTYQNDVTLVASGSATGAGLVNIINGVGTINISDHIAETVNLTLSDSQTTGLDVSSTQDVIFTAGVLHHFDIANVSSPQIAGSDISLIVTAKDSFGNTVPSFTGTVDFSTTAGTITPATSNNFISGVLTQNVQVTQAGSGKSITVTHTGGSEVGNTNLFIVNPGATAKFILNNPGDMTVSTRLSYTVTRRDQNNNLVTSGADTVYLYSTSGPTSGFFDAATAGNHITSISIPDTQSSVNFWYFDDTAGNWTITASDNATASDGATGILDGSDPVNVLALPIVATRFVISDPVSTTVGSTAPITVSAEDTIGNVDTTYNNNVTLHTSGNATNGGIVNIVNGVGTINILDTKAETVALTLEDTGGTSLDITSTKNIDFLAGSTAQFIITGGSAALAGDRTAYVVSRQDQYNNPVTTGTSTVYFYS